MNIKALIIFLLLVSGFTAGSFLYDFSSQEEKPTDPFAQSPQDTGQSPENARPSFAPPSQISPDSPEQNRYVQKTPFQAKPTQNPPIHNPFTPETPTQPEHSPGVGETIAQLACKSADAVARADPDGQRYDCDPSEASSNPYGVDLNIPAPSPQDVNQNENYNPGTITTPTDIATPPPAPPQPPTTVPTQTAQASHLHETVTKRFPANGVYPDGLDIDGWPVRCGDIPITVIDSFYTGDDSSSRGRYDGYTMSSLRTTTRANRKSSELLLSSSALKTKRTLTKLYQFYSSCAASRDSTMKEKTCWVAEKGKQDGWLTQDGVLFLCQETNQNTCADLRHCFSGPPPMQAYTPIDPSGPLVQQYTGDFPSAGSYPPGSLNIDGLPVRCGNTPIRISSRPQENWLGKADVRENMIHLNRDALAHLNTASKLGVFADECAHITYQASNYEAQCGSWMIGKQNGWVDERSVDNYCRRVEANFYANEFYLEHASPEAACQRAHGCYAGSIQPIRGSLWGR